MRSEADLTKRRAMPVLSIPFTKVEMGDDGYVHFEGYGTAEVTDGDGEIVDLASVRKAMPDYMTRANVREMHQLSAVGKVQEWREQDGGVFLKGIVVDPDAITKCIERIYTGLSIGARTAGKQGNRVFVKRINEFSLVDDPACPKCTATFSKLNDPEEDGMPEVKKSLFMVAQGAEILDKIAALRSALQAEMEMEGHVSPVAARLEAHVKDMGDTLVMLTQEETSELVEQPGAAASALGAGQAPVADVAQVQAKADLVKVSAAAKALAGDVHKQLLSMAKKLAATHKLDVSEKCDKCESMKAACGKVHKEMGGILEEAKETIHPTLHGRLSAVHKAFGDAIGNGDPADGKEPKKEVPADTQEKPSEEAEEKPETPAEEAAEGEKIHKLTGQVNDLTKVLAEKDSIIKARDERIKELEAQPAAPKGVTKAIGKESDAVTPTEPTIEDKIKKALDAATPTNATEVIKLVHQTPQVVRLSGATKEAE